MPVQDIINALVQLGGVLLIAALAWLAFGRRKAGYLEWNGLSIPPVGWWKGALLVLAVMQAISIPLFHFGPGAEIATADGTVGGRFATEGITAASILAMAIIAFAKTGLTEEILFRGVIGRNLIGWLGFRTGNTIQALLFGAIHLAILAVPGAPAPSAGIILVIFGIPALAGWMMGWANEKFGGGTIWPGWLIHSSGNFISYLLFAI